MPGPGTALGRFRRLGMAARGTLRALAPVAHPERGRRGAATGRDGRREPPEGGDPRPIARRLAAIRERPSRCAQASDRSSTSEGLATEFAGRDEPDRNARKGSREKGGRRHVDDQDRRRCRARASAPVPERAVRARAATGSAPAGGVPTAEAVPRRNVRSDESGLRLPAGRVPRERAPGAPPGRLRGDRDRRGGGRAGSRRRTRARDRRAGGPSNPVARRPPDRGRAIRHRGDLRGRRRGDEPHPSARSRRSSDPRRGDQLRRGSGRRGRPALRERPARSGPGPGSARVLEVQPDAAGLPGADPAADRRGCRSGDPVEGQGLPPAESDGELPGPRSGRGLPGDHGLRRLPLQGAAVRSARGRGRANARRGARAEGGAERGDRDPRSRPCRGLRTRSREHRCEGHHPSRRDEGHPEPGGRGGEGGAGQPDPTSGGDRGDAVAPQHRQDAGAEPGAGPAEGARGSREGHRAGGIAHRAGWPRRGARGTREDPNRELVRDRSGEDRSRVGSNGPVPHGAGPGPSPYAPTEGAGPP